MVVDASGALVAVNEAAEALFGQGLGLLARGRFSAALPPARRWCRCWTVRSRRYAGPRARRAHQPLRPAPFEADGAAAPLGDGSVLLTLTVRHGLGSERGVQEQAGLRSIVGLGRMLAHEIKNPLAGIRGAAQLLKSGAKAEDAPLAQLIVDETDRVRRLVDRMEAFSDDALPALSPMNIPRCWTGCGRWRPTAWPTAWVLKEGYDPSLPPVLGDEDQLIQVFLNLVKNAAEAAHARGDGPRRDRYLHRLPPRRPGPRREGPDPARRAAGSPHHRQRSRRAQPPARTSLPAVRHLQGQWRGPWPGPGRQAGGGARRTDRLRF